MCAQVLGRRLFLRAVPRWAWACVFVVLELALGLGGRNDLYVILSNFLALMVSRSLCSLLAATLPARPIASFLTGLPKPVSTRQGARGEENHH